MIRNLKDTPAEPGAVRLPPIEEWALDAARELERRAGVSFVAPLSAASEPRRAVALLALAIWIAPTPQQQALLAEVTLEEFAHWLLTEDPREIAELLEGHASLYGIPAQDGQVSTHEPVVYSPSA
ncbi:hypothetical protein SAMN05421763_11418 [[Luteovulum] sphaeroides subsp. megalophilum]|uniref:hypothetical protein n=1 Tax=Cereibacter sphaeroides TaxID=1063 RepID=UPI000B6F0954|nr:hypothetical protein [Cereibacter sphaeroides]SNT39420.1 hypothetical protein SAMN05421763_11418 [[Luteovulum] sphaeroides subsp. megalophilum]